jgi:hypothetical protein
MFQSPPGSVQPTQDATLEVPGGRRDQVSEAGAGQILQFRTKAARGAGETAPQKGVEDGSNHVDRAADACGRLPANDCFVSDRLAG